VNNTHLLKSTTFEDIISGNKLALEVSKRTNTPLKYNVALEDLVSSIKDIKGEIFPISLYMREEWML
jgi:hypothetical protein